MILFYMKWVGYTEERQGGNGFLKCGLRASRVSTWEFISNADSQLHPRSLAQPSVLFTGNLRNTGLGAWLVTEFWLDGRWGKGLTANDSGQVT